MKSKNIPQEQLVEHERWATSMVTAMAARLGSESSRRSSEARYRAVVEAWEAVKNLPVSNRILRTAIARAFGFASQESVWRIVCAHHERTTGQRTRRGLGGYDRTWAIIEGSKP